MKKIIIQGEIGWDVFPFMVQEQVDQASKNEDLEVFLSSPGGSVFKGIDIVDIFKNFKRENPSSQMILHMGAIAASMGSFISASKVFDLVTAEDTTSHMRHNPIMGVFGDYREMESSRIFLEGLTKMASKIFSIRSGQPIEEERADMDAETWLFGNEIVKAGFADELMKTDSGSDKATSFTFAKMKYKEVKAKVLKSEIEPDEFSRVAAIVNNYKIDRIEIPSILINKTGALGKSELNNKSTQPASGGKNNQEVVIMNKDELKAKHPDIYAEVTEEAKTAGIDQEKKERSERIKALLEMKARKDFEGIPEISERIDEGIRSDETVQSVELGIFAIFKKNGTLAAIDTNAIGETNPGSGDSVSGEKSKSNDKGEF